MKVIIIMGSKSDMEWSKKIVKTLEKFGIRAILRVASAHKVPLKVLEIIREYEDENAVFITVAGRSNALSGFVDANTVRPVIACPPYSDKFSGADIFSSLRMPSGVCPMVVLEPEQAGLAAAKILACLDKKLQTRIKEYQEEKRREIEEADGEVIQNK
ncbi:AIR carboxylase family protein [Candidatus Aminicenantes bacterium AC-335-B20]|jgi:5-(carboxyamino)imidazole ribonucleotide mutase|nr:AIR carboxylase family protein [SCandidatus Aminicenantes bacterium Aminicenantia_JdfR_composite]MCP2599281.1 AIR carboxylase family protein [Candidatus Aminicenantes bacterium AC-335-B20]MCP2620763.1 AIR carboxylase family protein [Candidatus Aminicenantes bacterium AC-334-E05]